MPDILRSGKLRLWLYISAESEGGYFLKVQHHLESCFLLLRKVVLWLNGSIYGHFELLAHYRAKFGHLIYGSQLQIRGSMYQEG